MSANTMMIFVFMALLTKGAIQRGFIPTSEVVKVASMAAHDEGYDVNAPGMYLDELRTKDGKEPIQGYTSIALYKDDEIVQSYSIRVATGDIVDATECKIFRYPNLLAFKRAVLASFRNKDVSIQTIATEIGCNRLEVVPKGH